MGGNYTSYQSPSGQQSAQVGSTNKSWGDYTSYKAPTPHPQTHQNFDASRGGYTPISSAQRMQGYQAAAKGMGDFFYQNVTLPQQIAAEEAAKRAAEEAARLAEQQNYNDYGS